MKTTQDMARYVHSTAYADIDPTVIERAKNLALSSLGSAVLGANMSVTRLMADYVREAGGKPEAGVIGHGFKTSSELAAAMNCTASHCTELEDVSFPDATYTCFLIPTVFALGDALKASGRQVLEALILGYELTARPGTICSDDCATPRGWLPGSMLGTAGVAGVAAKMMGLSLEQIWNAIAIAASFAAGLNRQTGSGAHVIEAGFAGRNGIMAATLAGKGLTGNPTIMEGRAGFWDAMAGQPDLDFRLGTGSDFMVMNVGMKKYPCCYLTQRIVDGLLALKARHAIQIDAVESVEIGVNQIYPQILKYAAPENGEQARFSLPHITTAALAGESMFFDTFTTEKAHDPRLTRHRDKVKLTIHPEWGIDQLGEKNTLVIRMKDGAEYERVCFTAHGDPSDPLSRDEVVTRYHACADGIMDAAALDEVADMLCDLEHVEDVSRIMDRLTFPAEAARAA
jgi:2-methylcitrate dehydratase PrpD